MTNQEKVARAIYFSRYSGDYKPIPWIVDAANAVLEALRQPDSMQVREQMLCENYGPEYRIYERYGSNRPRAMWDVT